MIVFFDPIVFADDLSVWALNLSTDQKLGAVHSVLSWEKVDWPLQVRREEFECVGVLLMSEGRTTWGINHWIESLFVVWVS